MQTMADTSGAERVPPEDRELVEKLAKLQNMYKQVSPCYVTKPRPMTS